MPSSRPAPKHTPASWALLALLVCAPQLFGGVFDWSVAVIAGATSIVAVVALTQHWSQAAGARLDAACWALLLATAWTFAQALPIPQSITGALAPDALADMRRVSNLLGVHFGNASFSRAPGATQLEAVKWLTILSVYATCWLLSVAGGRERVVRSVAVAGLVMTLVAITHSALHADRVFGLYQPVEAVQRVLAPIMNPNHLGGFLSMCLPPMAAAAWRGRATRLAFVWPLVMLATLVVIVWTDSRGALISAGLALIAFPFALRGRDRASDVNRLRVWLVSALVLAGLAATGIAVGRLGDSVQPKWQLLNKSLAFAFNGPWVGVGRGAFESSFTEVFGSAQRASHPENIVAQWLSEWGLLAGTLIALFIVRAWLPGMRSRSLWRATAGMSILTIVVHDMVDFTLEGLGAAVPAAALLAAASAPHRRESAQRTGPLSLQGLIPICAVLGALGAGWLCLSGPNGLQDNRRALAAVLDQPDPFREHLRRAARLHPADAGIALYAATEAANRRDDAAAIAWLNRALERAPGWGSPHALASQLLARRGAVDQALLELRLALERDPNAVGQAGCAALRAIEEPSQILRALPTDPDRQRALDHLLAKCFQGERKRLSALDTVLAAQHPALRGPGLRLAQACLADNDLACAETVAAGIMDNHPNDRTAILVLARALRKQGEYARAERVLAEALAAPEKAQTVALLREKAQVFAAMQRQDEMRDTIEDLRRLASDRRSLAASYELAGDLEIKLGNQQLALRAYEQAQQHLPSAQLQRKVARLRPRPTPP